MARCKSCRSSRCILLLLQLFLHLLSTYINLLHLLCLNQSFSCFLQLVPSISSSVGPVYIFHPLHVPLSSSKHLPQVIIKHDHTTSHHLPFPAYLLLFSIPTCASALLYSSCPPNFHPRNRSFCFSQNSYFIFSQKPRFTSI